MTTYDILIDLNNSLNSELVINDLLLENNWADLDYYPYLPYLAHNSSKMNNQIRSHIAYNAYSFTLRANRSRSDIDLESYGPWMI